MVHHAVPTGELPREGPTSTPQRTVPAFLDTPLSDGTERASSPASSAARATSQQGRIRGNEKARAL
eukprot:12883741-Prorocentrum_lima.AAC.1